MRATCPCDHILFGFIACRYAGVSTLLLPFVSYVQLLYLFVVYLTKLWAALNERIRER
jgi:hypothetical protein